MTLQAANKALVIGWDGATFDLIKPWLRQGHLPNTARLLESGAHRILNSVIPTLSPTAWTSFYTGKNPGRHGTFDFVVRAKDSYELVSHRNDLPSLGTLFHYLSAAGKRVGCVNVPFTYPPQAVNGFMVSGLSADIHWQFTYPPELGHELVESGYLIDNPIHYAPGNDAAYLEAALETTRTRAETVLRLMKREEWDFFMAVFMNVDQILSFLWHHMDNTHPRHDPSLAHLGDGILELHKYLDGILGQMIEIAGPDTLVILASDHGMGPLYKEVFLNNWLEQKGYLVRHKTKKTQQSYASLARKIGLTREGLWRRLGRARTQQLKRLLPQAAHGLIPTEHPSLSNQVDWSRTTAYSFGNIGQIYVNIEGREPQGIVHPGQEYDDLLNRLREDLNDMVDPETREKLVDAVYTKKELYNGPFLENAPDLNVIMKNYSYITQMRRELAGNAIIASADLMSGFHRREGIFAAQGHNVVSGERAPASIIDVAPTILYAMDLPIPSDMDGQPMLDLFSPSYTSRHPVESMAPRLDASSEQRLSAEEEAKTLERLRDLGYLS